MESIATISYYLGCQSYKEVASTIIHLESIRTSSDSTNTMGSTLAIVGFLGELESEHKAIELIRLHVESSIQLPDSLLARYQRIKKICDDLFNCTYFVEFQMALHELLTEWVDTDEFQSLETHKRKQTITAITTLVVFIGELRADIDRETLALPWIFPKN